MKKIFEKEPSKSLQDIFQLHKNGRIRTELMDPGYRSVWSGLFAELNNEEMNALYYALKPGTYAARETIFKQGEKDTHLYFINQGELKLIHQRGKKELLLEALGPGSLAGQETFFSKALYPTASLVAESPVTLSILEPEFLPPWNKRYPKLIATLKNYANKPSNLEEFLQTKNLDRRVNTRFTVRGTALIEWLDSQNVPPQKSLKTGLRNISRGGLCFGLTMTRPEIAPHLLGLKINLRMAFFIDQKESRMEKTAVIVGIHPQADQYTIHAKFIQA